MRHIKNYKTFEGLIPKYNEKKWKDFLDVAYWNVELED